MSDDFYVMYEGQRYEAEDFADGVSYAKDLGASAVLYAAGGETTASGNIYGDGVNLTITGGTFAKSFYTGFESEGSVASQTIRLEGGAIAGASYNFEIGTNGGTIGAVDFTMTGGVIGQHLLIGGDTTGTLGPVTLNLLGGTVTKRIICSSSNANAVQGDTVVNIDGLVGATSTTAGVWFFTGKRVSPTSVTVNLKSGALHLICLGSDTNGVQMTCPMTVNLSGGSTNWLIASYANASVNGDLTVNMSGGYVNTNFWLGNNKTVDGNNFVESIGTNTINLSGGSVKCAIHAGGRNIHQGDTVVNISGTFYQMAHIYAGGNNAGGVVQGNTYVTISGGLLSKRVYGGGNQAGVVGNTNITATGGGSWEGSGYWIMGGCQTAGCDVTGKATINIEEGANVYHVFGGGDLGSVLGGVEINVTGGEIHGVVQGCGYKSAVEGGVVINVTGGTFYRDMKVNYGSAGCVVGGGTRAENEISGDIVVNVSGGVINGSVVGGTNAGTHIGNVALTVANTVLGIEVTPETEGDPTFDGGNIWAVAGNRTVVAGSFTAAISNVTALGALYHANGGNEIEGDTVITVTDSTFGDGIYLEHGAWTQTVDPDTGEITIDEYFTSTIDGNVAISLTNVAVTGDVWGKGRFFDLASFAEGKGATLSIAGSFSATGEVGYFSNINLAAGATIAAGVTTASAITAEAAAADGLYTLATGFAAQDSVITVVGNGGALGSVTLTEEVTSGSFTAGGDTYNVGIADDVLYLGKNTAIPEPTPPVPPTPTATGAEVILTITDPNHDYRGATGGWKVQADQTVAWQDLTTLGEGYAYLGLGVTAAGKAMPDMYVYNAEAKYVAAYVTDDTGAISGFESIFLGEGALSQVGIADFNADGVSDLLLRTADGFVGTYANGQFAEVQGLGTEWTVAALGDVDGNGRADIVIAHEAGYVGAYLIGADGSISWADLGNVDATTAIVGAGDVNGDGTDDVIVQVGANYFGAWLCGSGSVTGFFGIGEFNAEVQDIADYNADGTDDLLFRTADGVVGAALITGADATTWAEYGALGAEWSTKGVGIL